MSARASRAWLGELPEETRLAHARLPDHRDYLAVPQARPVEGAAKLLQLRDRHRAERGDLDEALGQVQRLGGEPDAAMRAARCVVWPTAV